MPIRHFEKFHKVNYNNLKGGLVPEQTSLDYMRKSFLCGCNYRRWGNIFFANDPNPKSGELSSPNGTYYIVYPSTSGAGDNNTFGMGVSFQCWNTQNMNNPLIPSWDGFPQTGLYSMQVSEKSIYSTPHGPGYYNYRSVPNSQNSFGPFSWSEYSIAAEVASIAVYTAPEPVEQIIDYGNDTDGRNIQYNLKDDTFNINQPLRGISGPQDDNGSVGTICQQIDRENFADSLFWHTRQCVFSWGHKFGNYIIGTGASFTYRPIFGTHVVNSVTIDLEIPIVARSMKNQDVYLDMAVVGEWDAGTAIRVTTSSGSYALSFGSTAATTTGNYLVNTIRANKNGDTLLIEAYVNDASAINIRTISFWESKNAQY